jgi:hypothetical protein
MAARKPLVLVCGEIQQLQSGDTLNAQVAEIETLSLTNGDAGSHALGDIVYISAADTVKKAKADAGATKDAFAVAMGAISNGASGSYQTSGVIAGLSGLTAGAVYYLSAATSGAMTTTPPSSAGQYVVRLGIAISTTEFELDIERPILL